ncbi:MAG: NYN domain-containing protein [Rhodobacteraceae bacterium]|nr:NYN domain-containing protein [Paracoccaceae bacterium]
MFYPHESVSVFIDAYALNRITQRLGIRMDFKKLRAAFAKRSKLSSIQFYAVYDSESEDNPFTKLIDWLEYNGYRVFRKNARVFNELDGTKSIKGTINTELSVDMVTMAKQVDHIVLIGSHVDYVHPVSVVKRQGTRVTVCSTLMADQFRTSDDLRREADNFLELLDWREEFQLDS